MEISEKKTDGIVIWELQGELMGGAETDVFQRKIYDIVKSENPRIILDMKDVKWMNSSGLGMIMGALTTLRSSGGDLCLVNVSDRVRRPIEVTRLDSVISMSDTIEMAINRFAEED